MSVLCFLRMYMYVAVVKTLQCEPLHYAGITSLVVGVCTFAMGCLCCVCVFSGSNDSKLIHVWCCAVTCVLLLVFTAAVVANSVFVFSKIEFSLGNGTYVPSSEDAQDVLMHCVAPALPFGLVVVSFVLFVLFFIFCCYSTGLCFSKMDGD